MEDYKTCRKCGKTKPLSEFVPREHRCRVCKSEYMSEWGKANRDKKNAANRRWVEANKEKAYLIYATYAKEHPEVRQYIYHKRRATKLGSERWSMGSDFILTLLEVLGPECLHPDCHSTTLTLDHVIPLHTGGSHSMANFQLLCRPHNSQKHIRTWDFRSPEQVERLLNLSGSIL